MPSRKKKLVVANWKMYPATSAEAAKIFTKIKNKASKLRGVETVVCPIYNHIEPLKKLVKGHRCTLGAQNCFTGISGDDFVGEVTAGQVRKSGAATVILGHSSRRALGEDYELVNKKVLAALKAGLVVVLCIGEEKRDQQGEFLKVVRDQLTTALSGIPRKFLMNLVVAYEPVWAISNNAKKGGMKEDPEDMHHMGLYVRKSLADIAGNDLAESIPVIFGGSVNPRNAAAYITDGHVDGFLVGRASEQADTFNEILQIVADNA